MTPKMVALKNVPYKGEHLNGKFPLVRVEQDAVLISHDGKTLRVPRAYATLPASVGVTLSYEDLIREIRDNFDVLDRLVKGVTARNIRALVVSGAPGVGKTYSIEHHLREAKASGTVEKYTAIKGTLSPIGLYMLLWSHRHAGMVLLIDDSDAAFEQLDTINLLKAALDTGVTRTISYAKEASILKNEGIPQSFDFEGSVIFVSNIDFDAAVSSGSKLAPHLNALMSRSIYVDLGLHSTQALLARVENVCRETGMLRSKGLSDEQINAVVQWIKDNVASLRSLSLRTALQLASLVLTDPDWKRVAKVTLLRAQRR